LSFWWWQRYHHRQQVIPQGAVLFAAAASLPPTLFLNFDSICVGHGSILNMFGIVTDRWRIFHRPWNIKTHFTDDIIKACPVSYNFVHERDG
jgi:hypothetical protein